MIRQLIALMMISPLWGHLLVLPAWAQQPEEGSAGNSAAQAAPAQEVAVYGYEIIASYPHNASFFTQGLLWHDGTLYEGTGRYGESALMKLDLQSGEVTERVPLSERYFGEGIAVANERLFQLTWRENTVFEYDANTLERVNSHYLATEGWGITWDGEQLIVSDGSDRLFFLNPQTLITERVQFVRLNGQAVRNLNELEFIDGEVWANVWMSDQIVTINPDSGQVTAVIDFRGLREQAGIRQRDAVLNGIAWDAEQQRLFITGKLWPALFEVNIPGMGVGGQ